MFVALNWKTRSPAARTVHDLRCTSGRGKAWLFTEQGRGELLISFSPAPSRSFIEPRQFTALGCLVSVLEELPPLDGESPQLRATAVPDDWMNAADAVLGFFGRAGLAAKLHGRSLLITASGSPTSLLRSAAVLFLALDDYAQTLVSEAGRKRASAIAVTEIDENADEVLTLLDEGRGRRHLKEILGLLQERQQARVRGEIISALRRMNTKTLVQFDCGGGHVLKHLAQTLSLEKAIGVDASISRTERARTRLEHLAEVHHGSVIETDAALPSDATALLLNCLPRDGRLEAAERTLFEKYSFEFVFCIQSGESERLRAWAESVADRYGYRQTSWPLGGVETALLFRRMRKPASLDGLLPKSGQVISTSVVKTVRVQPAQWQSSLETFSEWSVDPRWLLYLPAGVVGLQAARSDGYLEHPSDAFSYYRNEGIQKVVVELKHMGSRAIVVVCRNEETARSRFGAEGIGTIYSKTGRPIFEAPEEVLHQFQAGLSRADFWKRFKADWVCLDGEILPWTLKAESLLEETHGELLASGVAALTELSRSMERRGLRDAGESVRERLERFKRYERLLNHYEDESGAPMQFAPFHLIATEGQSFFGKTHLWHVTTLNALARRAGPPLIETPYQLVRLDEDNELGKAVSWWSELSETGEEGLVIKPIHFIPSGRRGRAQPAIKCRGREHLRLVYGPEYDSPENRLQLLDRQALSNRRNKHKRVLRQFALSVEAVERFVRREPQERVVECVRGVLALETRES